MSRVTLAALLVVAFALCVGTEVRWKMEVAHMMSTCSRKLRPEVEGSKIFKLDVAANWEEYLLILTDIRRQHSLCREVEQLYCGQNRVFQWLTGQKLNEECQTVFCYLLRKLIPF